MHLSKPGKEVPELQQQLELDFSPAHLDIQFIKCTLFKEDSVASGEKTDFANVFPPMKRTGTDT
jgi:hypothetical protein